MRLPEPVRDLVLLLARVALGAVFIAHGWDKLANKGMDNVTTAFEGMEIPMPALSAWFAALVELVGGAALIAGLLLPLAGVLLAANMLGALFLVHLEGGLFLPQGYEYVLVLAVTALALGFNGGRFSLDRVLFRRWFTVNSTEPTTA
ncbi:membrane protein [Longimycelium tulufanense]|uniref:Membrane protein n=1 Tax=Longimycelium tulufanense TaxID=907463 RepID=A0A8J3CH21_9PSEU|nr:DoxX family protein [Longimycelium tulufanense]GGM66256.1 membrane protein [Longimycelium tulufanense]